MAIKNAKACQNRLRKLLGEAPRLRAESAEEKDSTRLLIESILEADASRKEAVTACQELYDGFLDLNELRVATPREIADCWSKSFPAATEKAESVRRVLNAIFDRTYQMTLSYLENVPKRELRKHLLGVGLSPFAAARVLMRWFGVAAIPVDSSLLETLEMEGLVPAGATLEEVQEILERVVPARGVQAAHAFLRSYVEQHSKALAAKRKKEAQAAAREERLAEEARAEARAQAHAKAQADAKVAAAAQAKAVVEAKAKSRKSAAAKIRRAAKRKA